MRFVRGVTAAAENRLLAIRTDRDDLERSADQLGHRLDVAFGGRREILVVPHVRDIRHPAGQRAINGDRPRQVVDVAGKVGRPLAVDFVGVADLEFFEAAQHVQQGDRDAVDAAQSRAVAGGDAVEPAAAARAAGDRAVFVADVANVLAGRVVEFGDERPAADARAVRFDDADHLADGPLGNAAAVVHAAAGAVGAGHERERAMVEIEQAPLGPFEQQPLAVANRPMQVGRRVGDVRTQPFGVARNTPGRSADASSGLNSGSRASGSCSSARRFRTAGSARTQDDTDRPRESHACGPPCRDSRCRCPASSCRSDPCLRLFSITASSRT